MQGTIKMKKSTMRRQAVNSLAHHGKTFRFASFLLSKRQVEQAARLYHFCRWIDDLADDATNKQFAKETLTNVKEQLYSQVASQPIVEDFLLLSSEQGIPIVHATTLIDGVIGDLDTVAVKTETELIQYAYKVAGVVGLMMCPILGAQKQGTAHAIDLGIAMQLTNIARDVLEDAILGRRYLPFEWCPVSAEEIATDQVEARYATMQAIEKVLILAERYYESARHGYCYLPPESRRAIKVVEAVYREIGVKLKRQGIQYWHGRVIIGLPSKVKIALSSLILRTKRSSQSHDIRLHEPLVSLVGFRDESTTDEQN